MYAIYKQNKNNNQLSQTDCALALCNLL